MKKYCADGTLSCGYRLLSGEPFVRCGFEGYCEFQRPRQPQADTITGTYFEPDGTTYTLSSSASTKKGRDKKNGK